MGFEIIITLATPFGVDIGNILYTLYIFIQLVFIKAKADDDGTHVH